MINTCTSSPFCWGGRFLKSWKSVLFMLPTVKACVSLLSVVLCPPLVFCFFTACKSLLNKKSDSAKVKCPLRPPLSVSRPVLWGDPGSSVCLSVCLFTFLSFPVLNDHLVAQFSPFLCLGVSVKPWWRASPASGGSRHRSSSAAMQAASAL